MQPKISAFFKRPETAPDPNRFFFFFFALFELISFGTNSCRIRIFVFNCCDV